MVTAKTITVNVQMLTLSKKVAKQLDVKIPSTLNLHKHIDSEGNRIKFEDIAVGRIDNEALSGRYSPSDPVLIVLDGTYYIVKSIDYGYVQSLNLPKIILV